MEPGQIKLPEISFAAFLLSLSHTAITHLDEAGKGGELAKANLPMAKHFISILETLREKTKGNLDEDEEKILQNLLFDLRMKYVEVCKGCSD